VMDRPTEDATRSVTIGRIYVHGTAMRPNICEVTFLQNKYSSQVSNIHHA